MDDWRKRVNLDRMDQNLNDLRWVQVRDQNVKEDARSHIYSSRSVATRWVISLHREAGRKAFHSRFGV